MKTTAVCLRRLLFSLGLLLLPAVVRAQWTLPSSPTAGTSYSIRWVSSTSGTSAVMQALAPGGTTWNSIGGTGGPPSSVKTINATYTFPTSGAWSLRVLDNNNTVSTASLNVGSMSQVITYYSDLPGYSSGNPTFPNSGDPNRNAINWNNVVRDLTDAKYGLGPKTLNFASNTVYLFNVNVESGGQLAAFDHVSNLTVKGGGQNSTTLQWQSGVSLNGTSHAPESFLNTGSDTNYITISDLGFTTGLAYQTGQNDAAGRPLGNRSGTGQHVIIHGRNTTVTNCRFDWAPNFSLLVSAPSDPGVADNINITSNTFVNSIGDGIHVGSGNTVMISNNWLSHCGDDGIAVVADQMGDLVNGVRTKGSSRQPRNVTIQWNQVLDSHWRGIAVLTGFNVQIWNNNVHGTARFGIEAYPAYMDPASQGGVPNDPTSEYPNILIIRNNTINYTGYLPEHNTQGYHPANYLTNDSHGIHVTTAWNVQIMDNTISYVRGYGVFLDNCAQVGVGGGNSITNFGSQVGAAAQFPGLVVNITGSNYSVAPTSWKWINAWGQNFN